MNKLQVQSLIHGKRLLSHIEAKLEARVNRKKNLIYCTTGVSLASLIAIVYLLSATPAIATVYTSIGLPDILPAVSTSLNPIQPLKFDPIKLKETIYVDKIRTRSCPVRLLARYSDKARAKARYRFKVVNDRRIKAIDSCMLGFIKRGSVICYAVK